MICGTSQAVEFARFSLQVFGDLVLKNQEYVDLIVSDRYTHATYYMGLVDEANKVNFHDGQLRVVEPDGTEFLKFPARDYLKHVAEHVEPWSYIKFCYRKDVGWKGFEEGRDSGVFAVAPLARLNASDSMATPLAQEAYEQFYDTLGGQAGPPYAGHPLGPTDRDALGRGDDARPGQRARFDRSQRA